MRNTGVVSDASLVWFGCKDAMPGQRSSTQSSVTQNSLAPTPQWAQKQKKISKTRSLGCFFLSFLAPSPMKCLRQAAFLGTTGMKKLEYPHCPGLGRQLIP